MTTHERMLRMYEHREADRVPITDEPWQGTILRWRKEGMPAGADWRDFFGVDKVEMIRVDNSPRYEKKIIEETGEFVVSTTEWGVTLKNFKVPDSTPEFLDWKVTTPETWAEARARMKITRDRVDWDYLKENFPKWRADGRWIEALFWFGFDVAHSWMAGFEPIIYAMIEDPGWVRDIVDTFLDVTIGLYDMVWDEGYHFDSIIWYDDMGYKNGLFFSNEVYDEVLRPAHQRAIDWAHNHGIKARLHSCGNIMQRVPRLVEMDLDALNPLEIKAGMDIKKLKADYGNKLVLHGGTNALIMDKPELVVPYIEEHVPLLKQNGGYIFSSDHSIPNAVSLENYRTIVQTVKRTGSY